MFLSHCQTYRLVYAPQNGSECVLFHKMNFTTHVKCESCHASDQACFEMQSSDSLALTTFNTQKKTFKRRRWNTKKSTKPKNTGSWP